MFLRFALVTISLTSTSKFARPDDGSKHNKGDRVSYSKKEYGRANSGKPRKHLGKVSNAQDEKESQHYGEGFQSKNKVINGKNKHTVLLFGFSWKGLTGWHL